MRTFFFGTRRRLYGTLARAGAGEETGVMLCYPGVQEYNMTHWGSASSRGC